MTPTDERQPHPCPRCAGTGHGQVDGTRCRACDGQGEVWLTDRTEAGTMDVSPMLRLARRRVLRRRRESAKGDK